LGQGQHPAAANESHRRLVARQDAPARRRDLHDFPLRVAEVEIDVAGVVSDTDMDRQLWPVENRLGFETSQGFV
jgi:hypothetical protein